ncbi:uncharacterized protein LOC129003443 [Macrosteles quadrilineatus]|uniref:uncharacterized protein LOC129003443 n=1 Tax=Macrosteles quadrilineatus TaxID=74068 RepID=UPI0023E1556C|nr:uncharacterized protein LOC129003443 [Macrosteles quadrilineatus]
MNSSCDPWSSSTKVQENTSEEFEDNFAEINTIEKLPDSDAYLASLEKKLARIKSGKGNKKTEGKELLKSLEESNDSCMYRLISGDSYSITDQDLQLDTPTNLRLSSKWLNPEQALTVGELVELVNADYLAQASCDNNSEDKTEENCTE